MEGVKWLYSLVEWDNRMNVESWSIKKRTRGIVWRNQLRGLVGRGALWEGVGLVGRRELWESGGSWCEEGDYVKIGGWWEAGLHVWEFSLDLDFHGLRKNLKFAKSESEDWKEWADAFGTRKGSLMAELHPVGQETSWCYPMRKRSQGWCFHTWWGWKLWDSDEVGRCSLSCVLPRYWRASH